MMPKMLLSCIVTLMVSNPTALAARALITDEKDDGFDYSSLVEDIEIMQRVLVKTLRDHFAPSLTLRSGVPVLSEIPAIGRLFEGDAAKDDSTAARAALLYQYQTATGNLAYTNRLTSYSSKVSIEGFYVPGTGVIYTLKLPAATKEVDPPTKPEAPKEDLWSKTEDEIRRSNIFTVYQGSGLRGSKKPKVHMVDEEKLAETVDLIVSTVAQYGSHIEQLSSGESIILAARLNSVSTGYTTGTAVNLFGLVSRGGRARSDRVIIRVPVTVMRDFAAGKINKQQCRERCEVTRYSGSAAKAPTVGYRDTFAR